MHAFLHFFCLICLEDVQTITKKVFFLARHIIMYSLTQAFYMASVVITLMCLIITYSVGKYNFPCHVHMIVII